MHRIFNQSIIQGLNNTVLFASLLLMSVVSCSDPNNSADNNSNNHNRYLSGGETTIFDETSQAFATPAPNLSANMLEKHLAGDVDFEAAFIKAPAPINSGLGPIFNNNSCVNCHPFDGRGKPPLAGERMETMFLRVSIAGTNPNVPNGPNPVPGFGLQFQQNALFDVNAEGDTYVFYSEKEYQFADGEKYYLREPRYVIENSYVAMPADVMTSPRVAPPVFGRGLLEAISDETLLSLEDENDSDGDGISGRVNWVWDGLKKEKVIGRFGLKANNATLLLQNAGAYNEDMGVTNWVMPLESAHGQPQADGLPDEPEVSATALENVTIYTQTLAVPARRNINDPQVLRGEAIFNEAGCNSCHIPKLKTGAFNEVPELAHQTILPYTDMLLHDMGDGLADGRPDFTANGNEWRTPPLWGIGLTEVVNGHTFFLHDGRARNFIEAVMWHGGEAENAKNHIHNLKKSDRDALVAFLKSL